MSFRGHDKYVVFVCMVLSILILILVLMRHLCWSQTGLDGDYHIISHEQAQCINNRTKLELRLNPAYDWGGSKLKPGAPGDCSGKLYAIFRSCGVRVMRTTARKMYKGSHGWNFLKTPFEMAKKGSLVHLTLQPRRPHGHVGILTENVFAGRISEMAHASSKWGFIAVPLVRSKSNYFYKRMDLVRQPVL